MTITGLSRALEKDIESCYNAVKHAKNHRIHTFIATSDIHLEHKLKMTYDECIQNAVHAVKFAKSFCNDVEFSCEDSGRSQLPFLKDMCTELIKAGALTINLPDTVGYMTPMEYGEIF